MQPTRLNMQCNEIIIYFLLYIINTFGDSTVVVWYRNHIHSWPIFVSDSWRRVISRSWPGHYPKAQNAKAESKAVFRQTQVYQNLWPSTVHPLLNWIPLRDSWASVWPSLAEIKPFQPSLVHLKKNNQIQRQFTKRTQIYYKIRKINEKIKKRKYLHCCYYLSLIQRRIDFRISRIFYAMPNIFCHNKTFPT